MPLSSKLYYFANKGKDEVVTAPTSPIKEFLDVFEVQLGNSSGADASMGWGYSIVDDDWKAGLWDDSADPAYIDDTTDAQDAGTGDFALGSDTVANDGFAVQAKVFPNVIRIDIGTAEVGTASVAEYTYWNGSSWGTLATIETPDFTTTGDQYLVALTPLDAALLASGDTPVDTEGMTAGYYAVRVRFTTAAGTSAPIADELSLVHLLDYIEKVADGTASVETTEEEGTLLIPPGAAIVPYASTADSKNWIKVKWRKKF